MAAKLMCEGRCNTPTWHKFSHREKVSNGIGPTTMRLVFKCGDCKHERTWGLETEFPKMFV